MNDNSVAKTYISHNGKWFFVSTIERDSSAMEGPRRYNETIVWEYENDTRGEMLFQDGDSKGSIRTHQKIVDRLFKTGRAEEDVL